MGALGRWISALLAGVIVFVAVTFVVSLVVKVDNVGLAIGALAGIVTTGRVAGARSVGEWLVAAAVLLIPIAAIAAVLLLRNGGCPICPR
jgi:hypothetical protein